MVRALRNTFSIRDPQMPVPVRVTHFIFTACTETAYYLAENYPAQPWVCSLLLHLEGAQTKGCCGLQATTYNGIFQQDRNYVARRTTLNATMRTLSSSSQARWASASCRPVQHSRLTTRAATS